MISAIMVEEKYALRHPRKEDPINACLGRQALVGNTANGSGIPVVIIAEFVILVGK